MTTVSKHSASIPLPHRVVDGPELARRRRAVDPELPQRGDEPLLEEAARLLLRLPHLDHAPAAVRARARDVEDAARWPLQPEMRPDLFVDLLRALRVVHHHWDCHDFLLWSLSSTVGSGRAARIARIDQLSARACGHF